MPRTRPGPRNQKVVLRSSFPSCPVLTSAEYSNNLARLEPDAQGSFAIARKKFGTSWRPFVRSTAEHARAFEELVAEALDALPENFARALSNLDVVIEEEPEEMGLLGLYQGVPLTERDAGYTGMLPDRISIYRGPIGRLARSAEDLKDIVRDTVLHELAHHFGIDDDRLHELGHD